MERAMRDEAAVRDEAAMHDEAAVHDEAAWASVLAAIVADGPLDTGPLDTGPLDTGLHHPRLDDAAPHRSDLDVPPELALVRTLRDTDPSTLSPADAIAFLKATERTIAWLSALQADALVACAGPRSRTDHYEIPDARVISIEDACRSEIAAAARWSEPWAHERIVTARLLAGPLPNTRAALRDGLITARQADVLAAAAQRLNGYADWADGADEEQPEHPVVMSFMAACSALEKAGLATATTRGVSATRKAVERALLRIDAGNVARRRQAEQRQRDVYVVAEPDGMAMLIARMGLAQAQACLSVVDGIARDPRLPLSTDTPPEAGIGERRAEALAHLVLGRAKDGPSDSWTPTPVRTHIDVVVDLTSLLGLSEQPGTITGHGPGGPQPLAAEAIRALVAADDSATMRRLVTDPLTGHLLDRGRSTYAVPAALRDFVVTRDATCRFPGCSRPAGRSQIDHAVPWDQGGGSDRANLGALCIRHHQLKTHAGWTITTSAEDGRAHWRSPAGFEYEHSPPRLQSRE
jgi:hypothetical protein